MQHPPSSQVVKINGDGGLHARQAKQLSRVLHIRYRVPQITRQDECELCRGPNQVARLQSNIAFTASVLPGGVGLSGCKMAD
ncbi:hypothetical protein R69658_04492 [Paraburkholderia aspalathi]|uniref:Uncharacterized protein n=1 Tax=Paraburkholderia aspalathi TaxID=1324617 RepID=A0ABN7M8A9_9BURK|nr:hypothetical protein R69658_04492 [Paraburkholderia aspalathi]